MAIRDRGKKKWQFAFGMQELIKSQRDLWRDTERIGKPIVDEVFVQLIAYAMEYGLAVRLTIWDDGFTSDITGRVHYVDPITHQLRIEVDPGEFNRIAFEDVVGLTAVE